MTYAFAFEVDDGTLFKQIVAEWNLSPTPFGERHRPASFATLKRLTWCPSREQLDKLPERYDRFDESAEQYWSVWYDPASERLYAEYGNW